MILRYRSFLKTKVNLDVIVSTLDSAFGHAGGFDQVIGLTAII